MTVDNKGTYILLEEIKMKMKKQNKTFLKRKKIT